MNMKDEYERWIWEMNLRDEYERRIWEMNMRDESVDEACHFDL